MALEPRHWGFLGIMGDSAGGGEVVEHRFSVGKEEKQTIRVIHSATTGKATVVVNGKSVVTLNGRALRSISNEVDTITISFNIGKKEKHKVNIRVRGMFWNHFEAYSDNDLVYRS